ncbi:MAG: hypothetical protein KatS3mg129_0062 [Leptospiraceae bacterium]|nr:MAG: hypothetical protein KatS3mg129_0062 [Leptospiraceae bacterium]
MKLEKGIGIILKKKEINEKDVIIDVLIKNNDESYHRKKFIVYGILKSKKRNPIIVEAGNLIQLDYYDKKNLDILNVKEINLINRFYELKNNYEKLLFLSQILELSHYASITDAHSLKDVFILLLSALQYLEDYHKKQYQKIEDLLEKLSLSFKEIFLLFFSVRLLKIMGYVGDLNFCSSCNKEISIKAKWQEGLYFYCDECDPTSNEIDFIYLQILRLITKFKFNNFLEQLEVYIEKSQIEKNKIHHIFSSMEEKLNLYLKTVITN